MSYPQSHLNKFELIVDGIEEQRPIRFQYDKGRAEPEIRTVSPYSHDGDGFLGFDHSRQELRRFSFSKVIAVALIDEDFVMPIEQD